MNDFDPIDLASADARKGEALTASAQQSQRFVEDLSWVMANVKGRRLMFWLLSQAGVFRTTFLETPQRAAYMALAMAHDEGRKELGYRLMGEVGRACPERYAQMMKENTNG